MLLGVLIGVVVTLGVGAAVLATADLEVVERSDSGASGQVTVPQVVGLPAAQAKREVEDVGLSGSVFNRADNIFDRDPDARVLAQTPEAGAEVEEGTVVGLDAGGR